MKDYISKLESGYNSSYEDDSGNIYFAVDEIGRGSFTRARKLLSVHSFIPLVVLDPIAKPENIDHNELEKKFLFYKSLYPNESVQIFYIPLMDNSKQMIKDEPKEAVIFTEEDDKLEEANETYRLILPLIPGKTYKEFFKKQSYHLNAVQQIELFIKTVETLADCHDKGLIIVDFNENNILFDISTQRSYLIDGGLSSRKNENVYPVIFVQENETEVDKRRATSSYSHIAPECWSTSKVAAKNSMDVYSLGKMMARILKNPPTEIKTLIKQCQNINPEQRPTLNELKNKLKNLHQKFHPIHIEYKPRLKKCSSQKPSIFQSPSSRSSDKIIQKHNNERKYPDWKNRLANLKCSTIRTSQFRISRFFQQETLSDLKENNEPIFMLSYKIT